MNRDEVLMYELLLELEQQTRDEEAYMMELLEEAEEEYEEEEQEMYSLDPFFPDDDYVDPGEIWELSAEAYGDD